jgi:hypothetical protein
MKPESPKLKLSSLADYLVRYDLATMIEEAKLDYSESNAGVPRLLAQQDIAARFRKVRPSPRSPDDAT